MSAHIIIKRKSSSTSQSSLMKIQVAAEPTYTSSIVCKFLTTAGIAIHFSSTNRAKLDKTSKMRFLLVLFAAVVTVTAIPTGRENLRRTASPSIVDEIKELVGAQLADVQETEKAAVPRALHDPVKVQLLNRDGDVHDGPLRRDVPDVGQIVGAEEDDLSQGIVEEEEEEKEIEEELIQDD